MAVIQISRIQIRRGKKNEGTGFPQLASGELGWAIDTQELYIGNGSVSEGSPAVGNTKILTDKDLFVDNTMLSLVRHIYKSTDPSIITGSSPNNPISRTLQQRLDDRVTAANFGANGNYDIEALTGDDNSIPLQRAIDQLFLNQSNTEAYNNTVDGVKARVILELPAGRFKITSGLNIPSYATLVGAGANKTILELVSREFISTVTLNNKTILTSSATPDMVDCIITGEGIPTGTTIDSVVDGVSIHITNNPTATSSSVTLTISYNGPILRCVNDSSIPGSPNVDSTLGITQPKNITLKGFTVHTLIEGIAGLSLESVKDSAFEDLNILGFPLNVTNEDSMGIIMSVESDIVTCEKNYVNNVNVSGFTYGVFAKEDIINNSLSGLTVTNAKVGISFGKDLITNQIGQKYGPRNNRILNCQFSQIAQSAITIEHGFGNIIDGVTIDNVGNDFGPFDNIIYPQIYVQPLDNIVQNVVSDRSSKLSNPIYQLKTVRMDLNRAVTASAGAYIVQMNGPIIVAEGFLREDVTTSTEIQIVVADDNQIFDTTNDLTIEGDDTPSNSNLAVHPTVVDNISENTSFVPYIPEVAGRGEYQSQGSHRIKVPTVNLGVYSSLIKLPVNTNMFGVSQNAIAYNMNYIYTSDDGFVRRGTFNIICNVETKYALLTDEYDYLNTSIDSSETDDAVKLEFHAKLVDVDGTAVTGASTGPYSIIVSNTNLSSSEEGYLVYSYKSIF